MIKTNIFKYYAFGFDYSLLERDGLLGRELNDAKDIFKEFFSKIDELDLDVTKKACTKLEELANELKKSKEKTVTENQADKIKKEIDRIDIVLDSELELKVAYQLTEKRYSFGKITRKPSIFIS